MVFSLVDTCGELNTTSAANTITVETTDVKMVWDATKGAGLRELYAKNEASPTTSRVGDTAYNLLSTQLNDGVWHFEGDAAGTLTLLEATRTRVRIRQRYDYTASIHLERDWTAYGYPRLGIRESLTLDSAQSIRGVNGINARAPAAACPAAGVFYCSGMPDPSPVSPPLPANLVFLATDNATTYSDMLGIPSTTPFFGRSGAGETWFSGLEAGTSDSYLSRVHENAAIATAMATHTRFYELYPRLAGLTSTGTEWQSYAQDYRSSDPLTVTVGSGCFDTARQRGDLLLQVGRH